MLFTSSRLPSWCWTWTSLWIETGASMHRIQNNSVSVKKIKKENIVDFVFIMTKNVLNDHLYYDQVSKERKKTTKFPSWMPLYSDNTISESLPRSPEPSIIETAWFVRACLVGFRESAVDSLACLTSNGRTAGRTHKLAREILANTRRVPKRYQKDTKKRTSEISNSNSTLGSRKRTFELECLLMLDTIERLVFSESILGSWKFSSVFS